MMRTRTIVVVAATLMLASGSALAEDEAAGAPERVAIPEAGVAITLPADWAVDIEMREREDWGLVVDDEDEPLAFWNVFYASAGGRPWCDLTWYPVHPMSLEEHALLYEALMTPSYAAVERTIEVSPLTLPAGEAYRFVIYNEPTDDWTTTYLLDADAGRYFLECVGDERTEDDWMGSAESLQILAAASPDETPEP